MDMYAPPELDASNRQIHPTALISPAAELGQGVRIGPYAIVEADVIVGDHCHIGAHAVLKPFTRLQAEVKVHEHAIIGGLPQDLGFRPCNSYVEIGPQTEIREHVTIHRASKPQGITRIGANCLLMAGSHVAHDCQLDDWVILANNTPLGGHVAVGTRAFISGQSAIHQFCRIGRLAMVSGLTGVNQDVPPFMTVQGLPARVRGLNLVGLRRAGFAGNTLRELKQAYRILYQGNPALKDALAQLRQLATPEAEELAAFIEGARRGFTHAARA